MSYMFNKCSSLIIFSNFNTCNVKDMSGMLNECLLLKKLNLSNFDTSKTQFMTGMFTGCYSLKFLDILNFNTNNVKIYAL